MLTTLRGDTRGILIHTPLSLQHVVAYDIVSSLFWLQRIGFGWRILQGHCRANASHAYPQLVLNQRKHIL